MDDYIEIRFEDLLILADKFELKPRDIVYIGSKGVTSWSRFISQLLPITDFINSSEDIGRN